MKARPVIPRALARQDIDDALAHYLAEAPDAAPGFIDALEKAFVHLARYPAADSPRYAHELALPGLGSWQLKRYPWFVFYVEREDHVDVWRLLHSARDIPAWLGAEDGQPD